MRTYIGNFGKENWAWPECLATSTLAVMDDARVHPYWLKRDLSGYQAAAKKYLYIASGEPATTGVATRWYNTNNVLFETVNDLWIHREKDTLWWTKSLAGEPQGQLIDDPKPRNDNAKIYIYHKPCTGWSNLNQKNAPLLWNGLHVRAKEFLFTEGTFQRLSDDNAAYAAALISGDSLSEWHNRPDWIAKVSKSQKFPVSYADIRKKTIARIANTVMETVKQSGNTYIETRKNKEWRFKTAIEFEAYLSELFTAQEGVCALSQLPLLYDGNEGDDALRYSLDRIDSDKHYERGNLQLVCKFINRWKGAENNDEFIRLIQRLRQA